ncbi:hypothetical protein CIRG_03744 [Coccidioides immitis RMSCC 2394]|uniref:Uncharacterized protein n=1 Tax=Coccidioides immitis RMSCC 2394 TaxID=404692 RepID=A0A0J6YB85_COCIT|nr:hypothetical protein CIRG_03744 [Coccidioides immitis RMSCC 2394]
MVRLSTALERYGLIAVYSVLQSWNDPGSTSENMVRGRKNIVESPPFGISRLFLAALPRTQIDRTEDAVKPAGNPSPCLGSNGRWVTDIRESKNRTLPTIP